ncbi:5406_t:CDS:2 [Entrophospora sp. SA101]|nr:5406_t:CDS:2 [Entrophospora sp. SA101]
MKDTPLKKDQNIEKISFDTLIYSNQTVKFSLTPNRLATIETPPPKLAPRAPVTRDWDIQKSHSKTPKDNNEFDVINGKRSQKEESLYDFLKNTSPEDVFGDPHSRKIKNKGSKNDILSKRYGKPLDKLDPLSEKPTSPTSLGNNPRYIPLIPSEKSSPGSPFSPLSPISPISTANSLNTKHSSSSLHRIKSLERMISIKNDNENINKNRNTHALNKFQNDSSKRRKHQAQDLIDFLNTTPPSEKTTFPDSLKDHPDSNNTSGKKTKLRRLFSKLRNKPSSGHSNSHHITSNSNNPAFVSASALVNRQRAKYIKIEIPPLPVKDTSGQTSFDQLGVQSKYVPKAISTSSLPYDPNNPNNTNTGPGFGSGPDLYIKNNLLISFHSSTYPDIEKITNSSQAYEIEKYEVVLRYGFNDLSKRMFGKSRKILEEKGNEYKKSNYHCSFAPFNELSSSSSLEEKIENRTDEMLYESFFRGRRLIGKKINLEQNNYEGHIFKESSMITSATSSEMELEEEKEQEIVVEKTRNWETVKKFDSFLVWQHNEIPKTSNDQIIKSLEWIKIANIVSTV